jgi:rod shape-determining protein MreC
MANPYVMRVRKRAARRQGLLLIIVLTLVMLGLGIWQVRARRQGRRPPVDTLLAEFLSPAVRVVGGLRNRLLPDPQARLTAVGLARLRQAEAENRDLRRLLALRDAQPATVAAAEVIGRSSTPWQGSLMLDKGAVAGVRPPMVALTPDGVLGRVETVTPHTAEVLLLTDRASGIGAATTRTHAPGVLKGAGDGTCLLEHLTGSSDVRAGDIVVTSGLGSVFPAGLPLGTVTSVQRDAALSALTARVTPFANPATVEMVVLIR